MAPLLTRSAFTRRRPISQNCPSDDSAKSLCLPGGIVDLISSATDEPGLCAVFGLLLIAGPGMCALAELGLS